MSKRKFSIRATPTVRGKDAEKILHEIEHGTPDTPQRLETIRRADESRVTTPIDRFMGAVEWTETGQQPNDEGLPYATHEGVMNIGGVKLRVYVLNTGQRVINGDDLAGEDDDGHQAIREALGS